MKKRNPEGPGFGPAGPDNPLGTHALHLSLPEYRIHVTQGQAQDRAAVFKRVHRPLYRADRAAFCADNDRNAGAFDPEVRGHCANSVASRPIRVKTRPISVAKLTKHPARERIFHDPDCNQRGKLIKKKL